MIKLALLVYDTLLTLPHEIEFVWGHKLRFAAVLYFMTRYATILYFLVIIVANNADVSLQVPFPQMAM
jgi:hypothetical protein